MADSIDQSLHDVEMDVRAEPTASTASGSGSRKRRLLQDEIAGPSKRVPIDIEFTANDVEAFNLLDFSDEVLLEMLLHCNSITLQALTKYSHVTTTNNLHFQCENSLLQNMSPIREFSRRSPSVEDVRFLEEENDGKRNQILAEVCDERDEGFQSSWTGVQVST